MAFELRFWGVYDKICKAPSLTSVRDEAVLLRFYSIGPIVQWHSLIILGLSFDFLGFVWFFAFSGKLRLFFLWAVLFNQRSLLILGIRPTCSFRSIFLFSPGLPLCLSADEQQMYRTQSESNWPVIQGPLPDLVFKVATKYVRLGLCWLASANELFCRVLFVCFYAVCHQLRTERSVALARHF